MAIIRQYHKDTNTTYVYESTSYWDAEKGQSRSKRKCIGKIDPITGEMIPTGKRGRKKKEGTEPSSDEENKRIQLLYEQALEQGAVLKLKNAALETELSTLSRENQKLRSTLEQIQKLISDNIS